MAGGWTPLALLPAAWTLALGWALLAVLRRWFDPVPRRVAAAFVVAVYLLFAPVLLGGKVLLPLGNLVAYPPFRQLPPPDPPSYALQGDLVNQIAPWQAQVRRAMAAGLWPLWNELAGAGMPLMADPQAQAFQPLVVASYPLSLPSGVGVTGALRVLVALVGMFVLLRRQGIGEPAALFGSLAYGLSGGMLIWLGWPIANAVAWTPMALYAVVRCHRVGGRRDVALLAATTAALLLGGHPETVVDAGVAAAVMVAACAWERRREHVPHLGFLARCGAAAVLAGLAVAPLLLLQQRYLPLTDRAAALSWSLARPTLARFWSAVREPAALAAWEARVDSLTVSTVAARAFGDQHNFWGLGNFVEEGSASVGAVVAMLALAAAARRTGRLPQEGAMTGLAAVCLLVMAQPPYFDRLLGQLPVIGPAAVHQNHRLVLLVALAAAYVAASEVERWRRGRRRPLALGIAAAGVAAWLVWAYVGHLPPWAEGLVWSQGRWLGLQLAAVGGAAAVLLARGGRAGGAPAVRPTAVWVLCGVVAAELLALHGDALGPAPARLFYPSTRALRFLRAHLGEGRLVGVGEALPPNFAQVYGLNDVRIDGPARPYAYVELLAPLRPSPVTLANNALLEKPGARLYDLLGVRYVMTFPRQHLGLPLAFRDKTAWIYEHPRPLPRLFLPSSATIYRGGGWAKWTARPRDFAARALVSAPAPGASAPRWRARQARLATIASARREPARWSARVTAPERRLLASSIFQDGGWRLLSNGRPQATVLANGPLVGSWLPAGTHQLELLYRPQRFAAACLLTALALGAAIVRLLPLPRSGTAVGGPQD